MADTIVTAPDLVRIGPDAADKSTIDFMFFDATIEEQHSSQYQLTTHPMADGLDITDHKRREPRQIVLKAQVSNTPLYEYTEGLVPTSLDDRDVQAWQQIKEFQAADVLISVYTQLEVYENMQIVSVDVTRNARSANVLDFSMTLREVRVAGVETVDALRAPRPKAQKRAKPGKKTRTEPPTCEPPRSNLQSSPESFQAYLSDGGNPNSLEDYYKYLGANF